MAEVAQGELQVLSNDYQKLQEDLQTTVTARQKLEAQQQENLGVQKEFTTLNDDSNIFKLVGSVLLKQDRVEASSAIDGRLDYIGGEIKRRETQLKDLQEKSEQKRDEIIQKQTQIQEQQGGDPQQAGNGQ